MVNIRAVVGVVENNLAQMFQTTISNLQNIRNWLDAVADTMGIDIAAPDIAVDRDIAPPEEIDIAVDDDEFDPVQAAEDHDDRDWPPITIVRES